MSNSILVIRAGLTDLATVAKQFNDVGFHTTTNTNNYTSRTEVNGLLNLTELFSTVELTVINSADLGTFLLMGGKIIKVEEIYLIQAGFVTPIRATSLDALLNAVGKIIEDHNDIEILGDRILSAVATKFNHDSRRGYSRYSDRRDRSSRDDRPFWDDNNPRNSSRRERHNITYTRPLETGRRRRGIDGHDQRGYVPTPFNQKVFVASDLNPRTGKGIYVDLSHRYPYITVEILGKSFDITTSGSVLHLVNVVQFLTDLTFEVDPIEISHSIFREIIEKTGSTPLSQNEYLDVSISGSDLVIKRMLKEDVPKDVTKFEVESLLINGGKLKLGYSIQPYMDLTYTNLPYSVSDVDGVDSLCIDIENLTKTIYDLGIADLDNDFAIGEMIRKTLVDNNTLPDWVTVGQVGVDKNMFLLMPTQHVYMCDVGESWSGLLSDIVISINKEEQSNEVNEPVAKVEVPEAAETALTYNLNQERWNYLISEGIKGYTVVDRRRSVDANIYKGVIFLRQDEDISPLSWNVEGSKLCIHVTGLGELTSYRKGNYVKAITEVLNVTPEDLTDSHVQDDTLVLCFKTVTKHLEVTQKTLRAYYIIDSTQDDVVQTEPEVTPSEVLLPIPATNMTTVEIVESIREDLDVAQDGVIFFDALGGGVKVQAVEYNEGLKDIRIHGLFDTTEKRKWIVGNCVNVLGVIMADLFPNETFVGDQWVLSTRVDYVTLRSYETLTNMPDHWEIMVDEDTLDDLATVIIH